MLNRIDNQTDWILCPVCGGKTREKVRADTVLENFPLFCPKCKRESIVNFRNRILTDSHAHYVVDKRVGF